MVTMNRLAMLIADGNPSNLKEAWNTSKEIFALGVTDTGICDKCGSTLNYPEDMENAICPNCGEKWLLLGS